LDRDGTLIKYVELLCRISQVEILESAVEGVKALNSAGFRVVVVTNQPVVARNLCSESDVEAVNAFVKSEFEKRGAFIDAFYYCPHHPETWHPEANDPKYRRECDCRKPGTALLKRAAKDLNIDLSKSFVVGDSTRDLQTARNASCKAILVRTGVSGRDGKYGAKPDFECNDLVEAAELVNRLAGATRGGRRTERFG